MPLPLHIPGTRENWPRRPLMITIDVEASPFRQSTDLVQRLIWGRFGGEELGIRRMMAIANRYNRRLTFFVDLCEMYSYPGAFEEIVPEILGQGHDVQLHAHPEMLPPKFWTDRKISRAVSNMSFFGREQTTALFEFLLDAARRVGQPQPVAFRAGGFCMNDAVLVGMAQHGLTLGFNYRFESVDQSNSTDLLSTFRWSNGVTEFPVGQLHFRGTLEEFDFDPRNSFDFRDSHCVRAYVDQYFEKFGNDAVLVMLMHSFSLLDFDYAAEHFQDKGDARALRFEQFLADIPPDVEVLTASEAASLIARGRFRPAQERDVVLASWESNGRADIARLAANHRIREAVHAALPPDAVVAVITRGDNDLLQLDGREGWHFPQAAGGEYAGYHPATSQEAIAHLEAIQAKGAQFLVIPAASFWWLDYYKDFRQHVDQRYGRLLANNDCIIFALASRHLRAEVARLHDEEMRRRREITVRSFPHPRLQLAHLAGAQLLPSRFEMLDRFPKDCVACEFGAENGDFSAAILQRCRPTELHLVDAWESERLRAAYETVRERFAPQLQVGAVRLHTGRALDHLPEFPDQYFDWVYIDSGHDYRSTAQELAISLKKVKPGGIIAGHDYTPGNIIAPNCYGVVPAVQEFCVTNNWKYLYLTCESHCYASFALQAIGVQPS